MDISSYRYTGESKLKLSKVKTDDKGSYKNREEAVEDFISNLKEIHTEQQKLYAERREGVIFIFQAMDAAGKDGVIRTVFSTLTPHGVKEFCFKVPSAEEASHDYLWRFWSALPARGYISIFNRSYYEDVLVGRVHKLYKNIPVPDRLKDRDVIKERYKEIKEFEKYLYNNNTRVVKIFLNVSKDEQARRFISRIDTPRKNWKISAGDIKEREYWDEYQEAFEKMVNTTSTKNSPWYVVPADHKWYARLVVSEIVLNTLKEMNPHFPVISRDELEDVLDYRKELYDSLKNKKGIQYDTNSVFANTSEVAADIVEAEEAEKIKDKVSKEMENEEWGSSEDEKSPFNDMSNSFEDDFIDDEFLHGSEDAFNDTSEITEKDTIWNGQLSFFKDEDDGKFDFEWPEDEECKEKKHKKKGKKKDKKRGKKKK